MQQPGYLRKTATVDVCFVIPSAAEGSAVASCRTEPRFHCPNRSSRKPQPPDFLSSRAQPRDLQLPVAERNPASQSQQPSSRKTATAPIFCHPERSRGICSCQSAEPNPAPVPTAVLKENCKPPDFFCHPERSRGICSCQSAEPNPPLSPTAVLKENCKRPICHPERSRGICSRQLPNRTLYQRRCGLSPRTFRFSLKPA